MTGRIRLGCLYCDRDDFDGIDELPTDWLDIQEVRSFEDSLRPVEDFGKDQGSPFDWQTHLGVCPECEHMHR